MNDIEKAIEGLKMDNELMQFDPNTGEDYPIELQNEINQDIYKANLVTISALEKQMPKKVKDIDDNYSYFECSCGFTVGYMNDFREHKYCLDCGQKIDWEVDYEP